MRRLFEGGVTNAETLAAGGDYSRAATIRGRRLIDEIRYTHNYSVNNIISESHYTHKIDELYILWICLLTNILSM